MIELPEAITIAGQIGRRLSGRTVTGVVAAASPHRFAWFTGSPDSYPAHLNGTTVAGATSHGGFVDILLGDLELRLSDGANPRLWPAGSPVPAKHQLRLDFDDGSALTVSVAMYGGIQLFPAGWDEEPYHRTACTTPSPLTREFNPYFKRMLAAGTAQKLSLKALLATEQRIPGLGNGVLQDVLWTARLHPRTRLGDLNETQRHTLLTSVRDVLSTMVKAGGRDTERDLHGAPGSYETMMCRSALERGCPRCGGPVKKEAYLGGSVYTCTTCQPR